MKKCNNNLVECSTDSKKQNNENVIDQTITLNLFCIVPTISIYVTTLAIHVSESNYMCRKL